MRSMGLVRSDYQGVRSRALLDSTKQSASCSTRGCEVGERGSGGGKRAGSCGQRESPWDSR